MLITTTKQIFDIAEWRSPRHIEFQLYSPVLDKNLLVFLYFDTKTEKKEIKPLTLKSIIEFQTLTETDLRKIEDLMWEKLKENNATHKASYDDGKTWQEYTLEGNLKYIGVENKEEMIAKSEAFKVDFINDDEDIDHTYFQIEYRCEWDDEHGMGAYFYGGVWILWNEMPHSKYIAAKNQK